jgi:hypothetical protein
MVQVNLHRKVGLTQGGSVKVKVDGPVEKNGVFGGRKIADSTRKVVQMFQDINLSIQGERGK